MKKNPQTLFALGLLFAIAAVVRGDEPEGASASPSPLEVFEQRIQPIFKSPEPASCVQCHLAGVDLKEYIRPSHEQTFLSLRDQGLIDLKAPEKSKILTLIQMGERDPDEHARRIHEPARKAEYEAFAAWIAACCRDPKLRDSPPLDEAQIARPARPDEVIRHARKDRVLDSFVRNVWSQRMRCFPCHTPHEIDPNNPQHRQAVKRHADYTDEYGDRMHLFLKTPEETLKAMIERSRDPGEGQLPLINQKHPEKSLLVLKPTAKLPPKAEGGGLESPSYSEPVSHGGGLKMHPHDASYKAFVSWLRDYARVVDDGYTSPAELPRDHWRPTEHVLLLQDAPAAWPESARVQLFVHAWDEAKQGWAEQPAAFTQNSLTPRRVVGGPLFLLQSKTEAPKGATATGPASLKPGKYLVKVYLDESRRLDEDPTVMLHDGPCFGQLEIDAQWGQGWPKAQRISASEFKPSSRDTGSSP